MFNISRIISFILYNWKSVIVCAILSCIIVFLGDLIAQEKSFVKKLIVRFVSALLTVVLGFSTSILSSSDGKYILSKSFFEVRDNTIYGWGDSEGGRKTYTLDELKSTKPLGDRIQLNSICDSSLPRGNIKDERNYVEARINNGDNRGIDNVWQSNEIEVDKNCSYIVRLYVNNNGTAGDESTATDVRVSFSVSDTYFYSPDASHIGDDIYYLNANRYAGRFEAAVTGYILAPNASPDKYWDSVIFYSDEPFELEYIPGTALLENNGIGSGAGYMMPDSVVDDYCSSSEIGEYIGYDALDGILKSDYQYASYICITVKPNFN